MTIPFNHWKRVGNESRFIAEAIDSGHLEGGGTFTRRASALIEKMTGGAPALLTTSCTHALELAALLLDLGPEDEVIVPSYTFVSTASAFALRGAKVIFCDIRPDTLNIDETLIESLITRKTKAICVVHYGGISVEMDAIIAIANKHNLKVVEDNAHGLLGKYKGRPLGSMGAFATQSFHHTKNFSAGEGGALIVNDLSQMERAEIILEKGTNRSRFFRGQVDKYTWVDLGASFMMSELSAAHLTAHLEQADKIQGSRKHTWNCYSEQLSNLVNYGVTFPTVPLHCEQAYHVFYMLMPDSKTRGSFIAHMKAAGISTPFHYVPLHTSPYGAKQSTTPSSCPITIDISERLVRLPLYFDMTPEDVEYIIVTAQQFFHS